MATVPHAADSNVLAVPVRREYLVWRGPDMGEADSIAGPAAGTVRQFGIEQRTVKLERTFAERVGVPFAITTTSRELALYLSLKALGLGAGDDVIVSAISPITTANAVLHAGANPVLADVDPATQLLTEESADRARTRQTRAIVVTHLCGRAATLQAIDSWAHDRGLALINDAGLGVEILHGGRNIAQYGALSIYGTDPARQGKAHEGGIITTNNAVLAERLEQLRRGPAAEPGKPGHEEGPGRAFQMTAAQASLGLRYLDRADPLNRRRRVIWNRYDEALASLSVVRPAPVTPGDRHALSIYTVQIGGEVFRGGRDEMAMALHKARIGTAVHYRGVHLHPRYRDGLGYVAADFPIATRISNQTLSLPLSAAMTDRDVEDVITVLTEILEAEGR